MPQCSPRDVINTNPSDTAATTTKPMTATTRGRHPVRTSSRTLVLSPTPAKVSRNAHFDTFPRLAVCPFVSQPAVAIADTARKPSTNFGNFCQMNAALAFAPGAISSGASSLIAFLFAPLYHPALRYAGPTRSELGVPTVFNFLGPVANPARPSAQAVGVFDPVMGGVIAGVLAGRGCSALVFHGSDGLDELTTTGPSTMWVVHDSEVAETEFSPADLGLAPASLADLRGGDAAHNAAVARAMLAGERGPVRDIVLLNAAAALAAAAGVPGPEAVTSALADGYARAVHAVDSGAASALLDRWIEASHRLDPKGR